MDSRPLTRPFWVEGQAWDVSEFTCDVKAALEAARAHPDIKNPEIVKIYDHQSGSDDVQALVFEYHPPNRQRFLKLTKIVSMYQQQAAILRWTGIEKIKRATEPLRKPKDPHGACYD
jgi:hypothetical protein